MLYMLAYKELGEPIVVYALLERLGKRLANIEIMLSSGVKSINKIKTTLRKQGFDIETIDNAINILSKDNN